MFEELFGYSCQSGAPRPTNSEYIARIADKVHMDLNYMESGSIEHMEGLHQEEYE